MAPPYTASSTGATYLPAGLITRGFQPSPQQLNNSVRDTRPDPKTPSYDPVYPRVAGVNSVLQGDVVLFDSKSPGQVFSVLNGLGKDIPEKTEFVYEVLQRRYPIAGVAITSYGSPDDPNSVKPINNEIVVAMGGTASVTNNGTETIYPGEEVTIEFPSFNNRYKVSDTAGLRTEFNNPPSGRILPVLSTYRPGREGKKIRDLARLVLTDPNQYARVFQTYANSNDDFEIIQRLMNIKGTEIVIALYTLAKLGLIDISARCLSTGILPMTTTTALATYQNAAMAINNVDECLSGTNPALCAYAESIAGVFGHVLKVVNRTDVTQPDPGNVATQVAFDPTDPGQRAANLAHASIVSSLFVPEFGAQHIGHRRDGTNAGRNGDRGYPRNTTTTLLSKQPALFNTEYTLIEQLIGFRRARILGTCMTTSVPGERIEVLLKH